MRNLLPILVLFIMSVGSRDISAKDLRSRIGVGFNTQLGDTPALAARYGMPTSNPNINIQVEADVGIAPETSTGGAQTMVGGRALMGLVSEDNLNLYGVVGVASMAQGDATTLRIQPTISIDWFLFGLENLGLTTAWGVNVDMGESVGLTTTGALTAGALYWF